TIQIQGVPVHVVDTAGLRESDDEVERIGIARAWEQIAQANAVLFLHDLTRSADAGHAAADADILATLRQRLPQDVPVIDVWNKSDAVVDMAAAGADAGLRLSALTGAGIE